MKFSEYQQLCFERRDNGVLLITMDPDVLEGAAALTEKRAPRFPSAHEAPHAGEGGR